MTEEVKKATPLSRLACVLMAVVMAIGICVPTMAFADDDEYTITIDPAYVGETYTAYKIFDLTYTGSGEQMNVAYTIDSSSAWFETVEAASNLAVPANEDAVFTLTQVGETTTYVVEVANDSVTGADIAAALSPVPDGAVAAATEKAEGDSAGDETSVTLNVTEAGAGYYFVTTTLGSVVSIDSTTPTVTIGDKNTPPKVDKVVVDETDEGSFEGGQEGETEDTATVGETLEYQITIEYAAHQSLLCLHDKTTEGLSLVEDSIKVYLNDYSNEIKNNYDTTYYTINTSPTDGCLFEIEFDVDWLDTLVDDNEEDVHDVILITYEVTVTEDALVQHGNEAWLVYGANNETTRATTETDVYGFELKKVDGSNDNAPLDGAVFELTTEDDPDTLIVFYYDEDSNTYVVYDATDYPDQEGSQTTEIAVLEGDVYIFGLEAGTYILTEVVAPDGYNILDKPITITITAGDDGAWTVTATTESTTGSETYDSEGLGNEAGVTVWPDITVINNAGSVLPSTGGMGTTIFYIIGGILVVGAVVLLITRRRMNNRAE